VDDEGGVGVGGMEMMEMEMEVDLTSFLGAFRVRVKVWRSMLWVATPPFP
jgi:ribulose 1,5-bisphosphate synthetase/thiazole synthase